MTRRCILTLLLVLGLAPACTKVYTNDDRGAGTPVTSTTPTPVADKIEFRVVGAGLSTFSPVVIRHTDAVNGLMLYSGGVPYTFTFSSLDSSVFLYVEAAGIGNLSTSVLQVQVYVNGRLFREGFSAGTTLNASASGTYRR